jgi:hypothetical protein
MRRRSVVTALVTLTATAAVAVLRRRALRARDAAAVARATRPTTMVVPAPVSMAVPAPTTVSAAARPAPAAVVVPFTRPATAEQVVARPATGVRCGDSGGRTKAGAPCGARGTVGGRCHHHRVAA